MVILRNLVEKDQKMIKDWRMMPEVTKYMYTDPVITEESQKIWFRSIKYDQTVKYWIINYDDKDIGLLNINNIDNKNLRCDWAYYIADESMRGKGIGKLIECNIYDYLFYTLNLRKVCCEVFAFNKKVIMLHEKFGAEIEGIRKKHIYKNGKEYDIVEMAILKEKWNQIRKNYDYEKMIIED